MKLQIKADLSPNCIAFLRRKLESFDTSKLEYFRLYDRTNQTVAQGVWGRCKYPNRKKKVGYRIRCSVSINAREFPYVVKWAVGTRKIDQSQWEWVWREDRFYTKEEAFVWIDRHEAFHWLRHNRQIPGANYETQANRYGFVWLDEWRALAVHGQTPGAKPASTARLFFSNGQIMLFKDQQLAFRAWLALTRGVHAAFRGIGDNRPVYPWDYVDAL